MFWIINFIIALSPDATTIFFFLPKKWGGEETTASNCLKQYKGIYCRSPVTFDYSVFKNGMLNSCMWLALGDHGGPDIRTTCVQFYGKEAILKSITTENCAGKGELSPPKCMPLYFSVKYLGSGLCKLISGLKIPTSFWKLCQPFKLTLNYKKVWNLTMILLQCKYL